MNKLKAPFLLLLQALLTFIVISVWGLLSFCMFCAGSHSLFLKCISVARFVVYTNMAFVSRVLYPMKLEISGTVPRKRGRTLVISNHKTRLDWYMLWMVFNVLNFNSRLLIVMKEEIRSYPIMGWAIQFCGIFLKRTKEHDQANLKSFFEATRDSRPNEVVLLFPEGTDLSKTRLAKSAEYAAKLGVPPTKYTLLPRTTGFEWILEHGGFSQIIDLTLEYESDVRINEMYLVAGRFPKGMFCHIEHTMVTEELQRNSAKWVSASFKRKEERLRRFHEDYIPFSNKLISLKTEAFNFTKGLCMLSITVALFLCPYYCSGRYFVCWLLFSTVWQFTLVKLGGFDKLVVTMSTGKNTHKKKNK